MTHGETPRRSTVTSPISITSLLSNRGERESIVAEHRLASQIAVTMPLAPQHVGYLLNPTRKS